MNRLIRLEAATPSLLTRLRRYGKHCRQVAVALLCFAFLPQMQAVSPAPDGAYPNFTTAEGQNALLQLATGAANTAVGWFSLESVTTGSANTGVGAGTLLLNIGDNNTATGAGALLSNIVGQENTANGAFALLNNTLGNNNTAVGDRALLSNTSGNGNNAFGFLALSSNTQDNFNNAFGFAALYSLVDGAGNTAVGDSAGDALTTGNGNVYIGIGMEGQSTEDGHTYIRNINTTSVSGGGTDTVTVDLTTGLLGHLSSSRRHKENIKPMENASDTLYRLKPVTYRYKKEIDPSQTLDYGLVAEDVAKVDPNLANRNREGQLESVRYNAINAMLLNEFLKEHRRVQQQQTTIAQLNKEMKTIAAQLKEQAAYIQQITAQLEASRPAPQVVVK